jgi:hypothetical protein
LIAYNYWFLTQNPNSSSILISSKTSKNTTFGPFNQVMRKKIIPEKTPVELFVEKATELKNANAIVKITTSDPKPYNLIVGRIIKLEKNWITLRKVSPYSDGKFPQTFTGDTFSLDYTKDRDLEIKSFG